MSLLLYFLLVYCVTISKRLMYIKLLFVLHINLLRSSRLIVYFLSFAYVPYVRCTDIDVIQIYIYNRTSIYPNKNLFDSFFIRARIYPNKNLMEQLIRLRIYSHKMIYYI